MVPLLGANSVVIVRSSVVLPAPLGPKMDRNEPLASSKDTPASACLTPNVRSTPSSCSIGSAQFGSLISAGTGASCRRGATLRPKRERGADYD